MSGDTAPLPEYDHLTTGAIVAHARALDAPRLREVMDYERAHGDRAVVLTALEHRLLQLDAGATPSGGDPDSTEALAPPSAEAPATVSPRTEGPPQNPPSQGVPTNPAQPRT